MKEVNEYEVTITKLINETELDRETCEMLLNAFFEQANELIKQLKSFAENGQHIEIGSLLHRLKGTSGNVRAEKIMDLASKAEVVSKMEHMGNVSDFVLELERELNNLSSGVVK